MGAHHDLEPYLHHLRLLPFVGAAEVVALEPGAEGARRPDATIELATDAGPVRLDVEVKRSHLPASIAGYAAVLRPSHTWGTYRVRAAGPDAVQAHVAQHLLGTRFGGTAGAYLLDPYYRGPTTVAYVPPPLVRATAALQALADPSGDLLLMRPFSPIAQAGETPDTVHPLLIYLELASSPDPRAHEAGERIRERWLAWSL